MKDVAEVIMDRMDKKQSFLVYLDYRKHLKRLSDEDRGKLFMAIFDYADSATIPEDGMSDAALMAFSFIKERMDLDAEKYAHKCAQNQVNGTRGGRPPKQRKTEEKPQKPSETERLFGEVPDMPETDADRLQKARSIYVTLPEKAKTAIGQWLDYKKERRETYKPVGILTLMSQVEQRIKEFGEPAVTRIILESISSRYQGITWDRLQTGKRPAKSSNPFSDALKEVDHDEAGNEKSS